MKTKFYLPALILTMLNCYLPIVAQWSSLNPGAGGQVQDIVCDPNRPGRLFLASDMEGIYESKDHGASWKPMGDLTHNRVYAIHAPKNNNNQICVGTFYGLEISNDNGKNFKLVDNTKRVSIGSVQVSPYNKNIIIAGIGWRDDAHSSNLYGFSFSGQSFIFRSEDGGKTWTKVFFGDAKNTDRNIFSIQFHPTNPNTVYIGSAKGVFKSSNAGKSWGIVSPPANTNKNRGISIDPSGNVIYSIYTSRGNGHRGYLYASRLTDINWKQITDGDGEILGLKNYWYPEVDPRSSANIHKVIFAFEGHRDGLYEGTFEWEQNSLKRYGWKRIWQGTQGYDNGWDNAHPNARFVHYTPKTWQKAVWSTTNQTIFQGKEANNQQYRWNNKYCVPNTNFEVFHWGRKWPTYSSRGTASTYTYDIAKHKNYVIQGQADNGFVESWDHGFSWSNIKHRRNPSLSDVQAVDIGEASGTPLVVAQTSPGYGGNASQGYLMVKKLTHHSPKDQWILLAGGPEKKGNLPNAVMRDIAVSPVNKKRLFMFSTNNGMYSIPNLSKAYNDVTNGKEPKVHRIGNGVLNQVKSVKTIAPHPTNENIVFLNATQGNQGVYKGIKKNGHWTWSKIYNGSGWDSEISVWNFNQKTFLFYSGRTSNSGGDGTNFIGALSLDEGETWKVVFTKEIAKNLRSNSWFPLVQNDFRFTNKGGIIGYKDKIFMSYYDHKMQKAYGVFMGTMKGNNSTDINWTDVTGDLHFGGLTSARIVPENGTDYLYVSTAGAGAWKRKIPSRNRTLNKEEISEQFDNSIVTYPNPVKIGDNLQLKTIANNDELKAVEIYTIQGELVVNQNSKELNKTSFAVNLSPEVFATEGLYMVKFIYSNRVVTKKILVTKE